MSRLLLLALTCTVLEAYLIRRHNASKVQHADRARSHADMEGSHGAPATLLKENILSFCRGCGAANTADPRHCICERRSLSRFRTHQRVNVEFVSFSLLDISSCWLSLSHLTRIESSSLRLNLPSQRGKNKSPFLGLPSVSHKHH